MRINRFQLLTCIVVNLRAAGLLTVFMFMCYPPNAVSSDLGRLFTTPAERAIIDKNRQNDRPVHDTTSVQHIAITTEPNTNAVVLNGIVNKSNGDHLIWINGRQVHGQIGPGGLRIVKEVDQNSSVVVTLPGEERTASIKPGQQWDLQSGRVIEQYASRQIDVDKGPRHQRSQSKD